MEPGERVVAGRYRLLARLGSGGMGTVWRAEDQVLGRRVAVKEITFPQGLSEADRSVLHERTRREARAAARLDHPSAVTVYDVVEDGGAPYLVMELVEARTLADVVRDDGPLSPQRAADVGLQLLGALEAAHAEGIVHRDVKPSNVLVRGDGRVVLTDFGIATATGDASITHTGLLLGSPAYIAPERARGEQPGPPSDLWSLGATLFTAVEGKPPYDGDEPLITVTAVVTGEHAPFAAAGPLEPVLEGLLEKDPAQRLDAAQARRELQRVAEQRTPAPTKVVPAPVAVASAARTTAIDVAEVRESVAPPPPPAARVPLVGPAPRRRSWAPAALTAGVLALVAGGVALALGLGSGDDPDRTTATGTGTGASSSTAPAAGAPAASEDEPATDDGSAPAQDEEQEDDGGEGVPEGWTTDTGSGGWTVALPPGYRQTRAGEYRDAATGRTLRVDTTGPGGGKDDAVADREAQAEDFAKRHRTYEEIRIEEADYRGYEAADWEFTYEGLHVLNRVFVVDGRGYSLFLQAPEDDADGAREDFEAIAAAFQPA